ncbi:Nucleotide-diphospho-sugar transferases,Glycosyltransferase, DXD sugar-binding [Cinara cedri]|uniref:Nucleotide-diphospho-sugar transferases,Glycosyltransferase, DXD sugar-binding n=1 Tax=Cinara cedri TaxID=506608 RepID=A0A5E4MZK3_9HEMI|nr:Nucleotide-diphospho-sugar transferases,Glycosyltransferase, DXD sugar-binding [Cinara cedri]
MRVHVLLGNAFCFRYLKRTFGVLVALCALLVLLVIFAYNTRFAGHGPGPVPRGSPPKSQISCYFENRRRNSLRELDPAEVTENSIFFIETSCAHDDGIRLNLRQACAVESAASLNPNSKIFVLFVSGGFANNDSAIITALNAYGNIHLRHVDFTKYSYGTPAHGFVTSDAIFTSDWPVPHSSDLLRFLTLWKFGGTYLDLDMVLMKSLEGIKNFACAQSSSFIASSVLNFGTDDVGKMIANITVHDFVENYRGYEWAYNGPGVITRALQKVCNTDSIDIMDKVMCKGFTVYKPEAFCPISWNEWFLYFDENESENTMAKLKGSMGIHTWNYLSKYTDVIVGSKQPYGLVAVDYCSNIFALAESVF